MDEDRKKHNGWTNYETWVTALHIDNDPVSYEYWRERARQAREVNGDEDIRYDCLATWLSEEIREAMPSELPTHATDLLNAALAEVNWFEIAKSLVDEIAAEEIETMKRPKEFAA